ncbi:MAG TPA: hypothetical protein VFR24_00080 [Candidatus Angelobacter sp.]|nr:hypothetical protein [Candidatus Angelobacter sp.]
MTGESYQVASNIVETATNGLPDEADEVRASITAELQYPLVTLVSTEAHAMRPGYETRIMVKTETPDAWIGWPDPKHENNSTVWNPMVHEPLTYPKFVWRQKASL